MKLAEFLNLSDPIMRQVGAAAPLRLSSNVAAVWSGAGWSVPPHCAPGSGGACP